MFITYLNKEEFFEDYKMINSDIFIIENQPITLEYVVFGRLIDKSYFDSTIGLINVN